jgi:hypothetical protein
LPTTSAAKKQIVFDPIPRADGIGPFADSLFE